MKKTLILVALCLIMTNLRASTYFVNAATGNDNNSGLTPTLALATISKAINISASGDNIYVLPGTYCEAITVYKNLNIVGVGGTQEDIIIKNTIGFSALGMAWFCSPNITVENITFDANYLSGGIFASNMENLSIKKSIIKNAIDFGGLNICEVSNQVYINNSKITNCTSYGPGSGMKISGSPSQCNIYNTKFINNYNPGHEGGAIYIDCNSANTINITTSHFENNGSQIHGGAIHIESITTTIAIKKCHFERNYVENSANIAGGAIYFNGASMLLENSLVACNMALCQDYGSEHKGGGLAILRGQYNIINTTIVSNLVDGKPNLQKGSGIYLGSNVTSGEINSSIIGYNSPSDFQYLTQSGSSNINYSAIPFDASVLINYGTANISTMNTTNLNIFSDPWVINSQGTMPTNSSQYDYHIEAQSSTIDSGDPNTYFLYYNTDLDNETRIQDNLIDMGCYETSNSSSGGNIHIKKTCNSISNIESENTEEFIVYPNPSSVNNPVNIKVTEPGIIKIYNQLGKIIEVTIINDNVNWVPTSRGLYLIEFTKNNTERELRKIIVN